MSSEITRSPLLHLPYFPANCCMWQGLTTCSGLHLADVGPGWASRAANCSICNRQLPISALLVAGRPTSRWRPTGPLERVTLAGGRAWVSFSYNLYTNIMNLYWSLGLISNKWWYTQLIIIGDTMYFRARPYLHLTHLSTLNALIKVLNVKKNVPINVPTRC